ncbi:hypothetical protein K440DRAFT_590606 [Wilcoxina mikolae CBS 423.85]|nr:hypothetical protein K440DRAFT_590606 [Wilcoxina mikolae CBS 423.85]
MDPPTSYPDLREHLGALVTSEPPIELDVRLVETFTAQLTDANTAPLIPALIPLLSAALTKLQTDPSSVTTLLLRLLSVVTFTDILQFTTSEQVQTALTSPSPAVQNLGLELLYKAAATPAEAGILASWTAVVKTVVMLALTARDTGVATQAAAVLVALLNIDAIEHGGAGVLWRRVFGDETVYCVFYEATSWKGQDLGGRREKTEAQSRMLSLLESLVVLDLELLCRSRFEDVEAKYYTKNADTDGEYGGLLLYAAAKMVEEREDVMMHMLLLEFYTNLLAACGKRAWDFLNTLGKVRHAVTLAVKPEEYTDDFLEHGLLQSKASEFVARMIEYFPTELDVPYHNEKLGDELLVVIKKHLETPYAGPHAPSLLVLRSIPPSWIAGKGVIPLVPLSPPETEFLRTIATLLPHQPLYREYLAKNNEMWEKLVHYASAPALSEAAVAALDVVDRVSAAGDWGVDEVLRAPGVMQMLVDVPDTYMSSRAGADTGAAAWRVFRRRWEVAGTVLGRLSEGNVWRSRLERRVAMGVLGKREGPGAEVATMEL